MIFFFNDTATTEIYTLSLHDALPICVAMFCAGWAGVFAADWLRTFAGAGFGAAATACSGGFASWLFSRGLDRKSTRLNSSHSQISYAVFCLKKQKHCYWIHAHHHAEL